VSAALAEVEKLDPDRATRVLMNLVSARGAAFDAAGAVELAEQLESVARHAGQWWGPRGIAISAAAQLSVGRIEHFDELLNEVASDDAVVSTIALDLIWAERYDLVRNALESTLRDGRAAGNRIRIIWNQACLANLELRLGRLHQAQAAASEAVTLADAHGMQNWAGIARTALAGVDAWRGDADACRAAAGSIAVATAERSINDVFAARGALALLAVGLGRYEEAIDELVPAERIWAASTTHVDPSAVAFVPDMVEAQARVGSVDAAHRSLELFRVAAEAVQRRWALAAVARCEGLLAGADGYAERFEQALALLETSPLALERARTQLGYGEHLRRAGRRREARIHLRNAHEAFSAVDAGPWADRAAAELRATGESVGPRTPDRRSQLSPQELQVAQLVGEGKTNKEIAAQLYLSPKTIEYHLANAYRKLDIHSRAELTRIIAAH
jgi:DNA-binding CsgD family transcriptional regulator